MNLHAGDKQQVRHPAIQSHSGGAEPRIPGLKHDPCLGKTAVQHRGPDGAYARGSHARAGVIERQHPRSGSNAQTATVTRSWRDERRRNRRRTSTHSPGLSNRSPGFREGNSICRMLCRGLVSSRAWFHRSPCLRRAITATGRKLEAQMLHQGGPVAVALPPGLVTLAFGLY